MRTAIVTGASGFIGNAVVEELLMQDIQVVALVHSLDKIVERSERVKYFECDFNNYETMSSVLLEYKPEVFYHFAWMGTAGPMRADEKVQLSNVQGTCNAVRLAASICCRKFVFASSIMEYEVDVEIKSMYNPKINSIYSTAKITADYMARIIASDLKIDYISALISNIYGPGEKSPRLINSSIRKLLAGERLSLSPGEQLYDFLYITDAAKMFVMIGREGIASRTYYIGNQQVYPLKHYMKKLRDVVAPKATLGLGDLPFNGVSLTYNEFDKDLLYKDTSFKIEVPFEEGIKRTKDWIKEVENCG